MKPIYVFLLLCIFSAPFFENNSCSQNHQTIVPLSLQLNGMKENQNSLYACPRCRRAEPRGPIKRPTPPANPTNTSITA